MTTETPVTPSPIFALASEHVDRLAALDPFEATAMGVPGHDAEAPDFSPAGMEARAALLRDTLARLAALTPANRDDEVAAAVLRDSLGDALDEIVAGDQYYTLRILAGPAQALREVFDLMPRESEQDWVTIVRRLQRLPEATASLVALYEEGLRRGTVVARRQAEQAAEQIAGYAGRTPGMPAAFADLTGSDAVPAALRAELEQAAAGARAAFGSLHDFLTGRYLPHATEREAAGRERYARAVRRFLGLTLDLEETYAWGWEEVARLDAEMRATAERIGVGPDPTAAAAKLDADPAYTIEGERALLEWLQAFQDGAVRELNGRHFDIPGPVQRIEAMIPPPGGALAQYYTPPSEDFSRPGRTWYPTGGETRFHRWRDTSTAYHEGVPGHHLQCAIAVYESAHLSRFQRLATWYPGHGEGWALYAERLMAELGYLDDPALYLGMLIGQIHRAVRVVVDLGAHLELPIPAGSGFEPGQPWTYERMRAFLIERAQAPAEFATSETLRYLGWPGQAISYKVGERAWLAMRDDARARHGGAFSARTFHDTALRLGSMGLDLLRDTVARAY